MNTKKVFSLVVMFVFVIAAFSPSPSGAGSRSRNPHTRHPKMAPSPPAPEAPDDVSNWCKDHPADCAEAGTGTQRAGTKRELCMDDLGDNDGTIDAWEYEQFDSSCP